MNLLDIAVIDLRCVEHAELQVAPGGLTLFWGDNGSGKTSPLEAPFLRWRGRSFQQIEDHRQVIWRAADVGSHASAPAAAASRTATTGLLGQRRSAPHRAASAALSSAGAGTVR